MDVFSLVALALIFGVAISGLLYFGVIPLIRFFRSGDSRQTAEQEPEFFSPLPERIPVDVEGTRWIAEIDHRNKTVKAWRADNDGGVKRS
jgi:hypothetical protein